MASKLTSDSLPSYWPYPLTPKPGELLSSWLARNSFYSGLNPYRFCQRLLPNTPIWDRDIDRYIPIKVAEELSLLSGISCTIIESMTFGVMQKNAYSNWSEIEAVTPMILSLGMHGRSRFHFGLQYCPYCLNENPYFRKCWRLAFNTHCDQHGCQLLDACPSCEEKIIPHRAEHVDLCWKCKRSLSLSNVSEAAASVLPKKQRLSVSPDGVICCDLSLGTSSTAILRNFRSLIKVVVEVNHDKLVNTSGSKKLQFELLRVNARKEITKILEEIIAAWPESFHKYMVRNNVTQRKFSKSKYDEFMTCEIEKLPIGRKVHRVYKPVVYTEELKNLRRRSINQYRVDRSSILLKDCVDA